MHEVGIMEQVLETATESARKQGARHIHAITLRVGALSGVAPEALSFAFEALAPGSWAEGATLHVETVPVVCYCPDCAVEFAPQDVFYLCPHCQRLCWEVRAGRDLELTSLEVS